MPVRKALKIPKAALAGAVALALTGAGAAIAGSGSDSPSPPPSASAPGQADQGKADKAPGQHKQDKGAKPDRPDKSQRPQHLHSEGVVKKADGTFHTVLEQRGTVETVSDASITVKSEDGYSRTYTVNAETKIKQLPAPAADGPSATPDGGKRLKPADGTIADIAAGDAVLISGVKDGDQATAKRIVEGAGDGPGFGLGLGRGHEKGHGKQPK
jgi:hypothetical protein